MITNTHKHLLFLSCLFLSLYIYTVAPNTVVATINTGINPAGIAVTPNGKYAYVANNNNYGLPGADSISVLNLENNTLEFTITSTTFNEPYTITINKAGTRAYVSNSNSTTVSIINLENNTVIKTIGGFDGPSGFTIIPSLHRAYVNNYGGPEGVGSGNATTIHVVDLLTETIVGPAITVDLAPAALARTPDGAFVYVINYTDGCPGNGTINVIRTSDNTVVATIPGLSGPFGISITPNGKYAYVTNFGSNNFVPIGSTLSVVDLDTNTIIKTIDLAIQPSGVDITPDGKYAYISNYNTLYADFSLTASTFNDLTAGMGTVNIIDTETHTVIPPTIAVGQSPANIVISPSGEYAYVSNYTSNTVNVIALQSFAIEAQGCKMENQFLNHTDITNRLTWSASGPSLPVSYSLYRDAALTNLIAVIPATGALEYFDHNRLPDVTYTYYLVGTNAVGTTSHPVAITVTETC